MPEQTFPVGAKFPQRLVALLLAVLAVAAGCSTAPDEAESPAERQPFVVLSEVDPNPASDTQAAAERDRLLHELRLYLTALTGRDTGSTHPSVQVLERNVQAIRDGLQLLYIERDMHGLGWRNTMDRFIAAVEMHYQALEQLRHALERHEMRTPPAADERVGENSASADAQ